MILGIKLNSSYFCDQTANYSTPKRVEEIVNSTLYRWVLVSRNNALSDYTGPK
jgi:hypothetical protein